MAKNNSKSNPHFGVDQSLQTAIPRQPVGSADRDAAKNRRKMTRGELKEELQSDPTKDYHYTRYNYFGELFVQNLPLWRLFTGRMMLTSDPVVSFSMNIRNAALMALDVEVTSPKPEVAKWVKKQWDKLWNYYRVPMVSAKEFGYSPLQINWKEDERGILNVKSLKDFAPEDCRGKEKGGRVVGMSVKGQPLFFPHALWLTHGARYGNAYGNPITRRQYPAWYEKWMERGAKRLQQLRMIKDAYIGDVFWYPPDMLLEIPDGQGGMKAYPWKDVLREIAEARTSGGAMTLPMKLDNNGHELTKYQPPTPVPGATEIFNWVEYCDENILRGGDIPFEVVQAADTGSGFSGRSIPFLVLLSVCNGEASEIVQQTDERGLRNVASLNFGGDPDYEIKPKNLVDTFSGSISGSPLGGGAIGGQPGQQPPPDGSQGVPQAVQQQYQEGKESPEAGTATIPPKEEPAHEFSCLLFNLPGDLAFEVRQLGEMIPQDDLAEDGREQNPHITIKFGLHSNDAEEVRTAIQDLSPVAIQIGKASVFPGKRDDNGKPLYEVVKLEVESEALHKLNEQVSDKLEHTDTHPDYKPHITLAYVKPGLGEYYAKRVNGLEGRTTVFDRAIFSNKRREWNPIKLLGKAQFDEEDEEPEPARYEVELCFSSLDEMLNNEQFSELPSVKKFRELIGRGFLAASDRIKSLADRIRKMNPLESFKTLGELIEEQIRGVGRFLGGDLFSDTMPSYTAGTLDVANRLPNQTPPPAPGQPVSFPGASESALEALPSLTAPAQQAPSPAPIQEELAKLLFPDMYEPEVHLPALEASVETLKAAPVAAGRNYLETAQRVKDGSFAVTGGLTDKAVADVRDQLAKTIAEGKPQQEFVKTVADRLEHEGSPLSIPRLENIFRTNTMSAYSKAQADAIGNPMVSDAFPYVAYSATDDARVRPKHWALESHGLNGTNIYRFDDPTFQKFRPPWSYNCRCRWVPQSVEQAARKGVEEAKAWLQRAKDIAAAQGGSFYQYLNQSAPATGAHVEPPNFEPDPTFRRDTPQFSEAQV